MREKAPLTTTVSPIQRDPNLSDNSEVLCSTQPTESLSNTRKAFSVIANTLFLFPHGSVLSKAMTKNHPGAKLWTSEQSLD